jgi:hypothetical protein
MVTSLPHRGKSGLKRVRTGSAFPLLALLPLAEAASGYEEATGELRR